MSSECKTLGTITSVNLNCLTKWVFDLIKKHLYPNAVRVNKCIAKNIQLKDPASLVTLTPIDLMYELSHEDFDNLVGNNRPPKKTGFYNHNDGRIYLRKNEWCIRTIIHETLHACSFTAHEPITLGDTHRSFFEALTEFYSGYILYKTYKEAYCDCWKLDSKRICEISYYNYLVKIAPIFRFIPLDYTYDIYFYQPDSDWNASMAIMTMKIKSGFNSEFSNPLSRDNSLLENFFTQFSALEPKIDLIQLSNDIFDFNKILV